MKNTLFGAIIALSLFVGTIQADAAPIHDAIREGNLEQVKQLLETSADIEEKEEEEIPLGYANSEYIDWTPLCLAVTKNKIEIAKYLLEKNANVNNGIYTMRKIFVFDKSDALAVAATRCAAARYHCNVDMVKLLLHYGATEKDRALMYLVDEYSWIKRLITVLDEKTKQKLMHRCSMVVKELCNNGATYTGTHIEEFNDLLGRYAHTKSARSGQITSDS